MNEKSQSSGAPASKSPGAHSGNPPPLFRKIDWLTFLVTTLLVFTGYVLTLAPDLTLEDSGELAVGSYYAGIPHPPGYPVWTVYTWAFAKLVPISNIAYRVALAGAFSAAIACGLLGFMVSRGSSMMMEGISSLKTITGRWENMICIVSGFVSGMLLGFNGYMWSQSVIVEVYAFSVLSLMGVLVSLMRWVYAPHQRRYVYLAWFLFGVCFTNHQSLLVAAMGIQVAVAAADKKLGRDMFLGNSLLYVAGLIAMQFGMMSSMKDNKTLFLIYNLVGVGSIAGCIWLTMKTQKLLTEWKAVILIGVVTIVGMSFYLYMPLAGMSNPPMQWGYPRTVEGFIHALTRGQYEKTNPSDVFNDPLKFVSQLGFLIRGIVAEFNIVCSLLALVPFFFLKRMQLRERAWMVGLTAIYLCLAILLLILLNPGTDRQSVQLNRVFFTASHVIVCIMVGYGLTLIASFMATHYDGFRRWGLLGGAVAAGLALFSLTRSAEEFFIGHTFWESVKLSFDPDRYGLPIQADLLLFVIAMVLVLGLLLWRHRAPLLLSLGLFALLPAHSFMSHWAENEQRGHLFGYWFGHDMFTPPYDIYPEMDKHAVLFGGTDPGRFCPTYMIFDESFIPPEKKKNTDPNFDRRDVYIITQNALADGTYLMYIRAHYNKSAQVRYDTPFFQELFRPTKERQQKYTTNVLARLAYRLLDKPFIALGNHIEKQRRVGSSYFQKSDFTDLATLANQLRTAQDPLSRFLFENLSKPTQELLQSGAADERLGAALAKDFNELIERELDNAGRVSELRGKIAALEQDLYSGSASESKRAQKDALEKQVAQLEAISPLYTAERFNSINLSGTTKRFIEQNPRSHTRVRLNRLLLEEAYPKLIAKSKGGVYPDREILTPTPEDSERCFREYLDDATRRAQMNPPQLKHGEDVHVEGGRVQVSGQVAVMAINGLLTKVIFDKNPGHEFYVEESFPLEWMYPYLTPFGIIMKINRQPLAELSDEVLQKDHAFWSRYAERLIGTNVVNYDTPVKDIAAFADKVYLRHDFSGFQGDRKFVRDDQAQKAFSKLRSSIGGIYAWRINDISRRAGELQSRMSGAALQEEMRKLNIEQQRMIKEADFAFRQAFAFCPYSPEAVFRYVSLLVNLQRYDDALSIAETCLKLDPNNAQVEGLVKGLKQARGNTPQASNPPVAPGFQAEFSQASALLQRQDTGGAIAIFDRVTQRPDVDAAALKSIAQAYVQLSNFEKLEQTLERLAQISPSPEVWYDLAAIRATFNKTNESLTALRESLRLNVQRLKTDSAARNIREDAARDPRFAPFRDTPDFQALIATNS